MANVLVSYPNFRLFDHSLGLLPHGKDTVFGVLLDLNNLVQVADDRVDGL